MQYTMMAIINYILERPATALICGIIAIVFCLTLPLSTPLTATPRPSQVCLEATRAGSPEKRVELFSQCIEKEFANGQKANMAIGYYGRGQAHYTLGEFENALRDYDKSIELNPNYPDAFVFRGILYNDLKQFQLAAQDFTKAIDLAPDTLYAYAHRAAAYANLEEYSLAILDYDRVLELDPEFVKAYTFRGFAFLELKLFDEAYADFDKVVELQPKTSGAYRNRGFINERRGEYLLAIADYLKALELNDDDAYSHSRLGYCYYRTGKLDLAIEHFSSSIEMDATDPEPFSYRAVVYEAKKKYDLAVSSYQEAIKLDPGHSFTLNNFAWLLITAEDPRFRNPELALEHARKAVLLTDEKNHSFLDTLAAVYAELGRFEDAAVTQEKVITLLEPLGPSTSTAAAMEALADYKKRQKHYN